MGRRRSVNLHVPPRINARRRGDKVYYFYQVSSSPWVEKSLGSDYHLALKKWAELEGGNARPPELVTFSYVAGQYQARVIPTKAPRTQKDNEAELAWLLKFFGDPPAPLDKIQPTHVWKYLAWRTKDGSVARIRATREKALFSHIWNWSRQQGYTTLANPCEGIQGWTAGRDVYFESDAYDAIYAKACAPLRDAMDLAYECSQRPADTLRLAETSIRDGAIAVRQGKTKKKLRIAQTGNLETVIERIRARKAVIKAASPSSVVTLQLIVTERGEPLTQWNLRRMFDSAREAAATKAEEEDKNPDFAAELRSVQFRDIRAKTGTDTAEAQGILAAKDKLGHSTVRMTEQYVRNRKGKLVSPTSSAILEKPPRFGKDGAE